MGQSAGLTIVLLLGASSGMVARAQEIGFERLGTESGLSHNSVFAVLQDRQGFLWLGTADGLNRYDGRQFAVWRHDPEDPGSLSSSEIRSLLEDRDGNLWVGTANGLNRFDRRTRHFLRFARNDAPEAEESRRVHAVYEDPRGTVWAGIGGALFRYDSETDRLGVLRHDPSDPRSLAAGACLGIQEDSTGDLWVLTATWGGLPATLNRLDRDGRFSRFQSPAGWDRVGGFLIDRSGRFWLNVSDLGVFDPETGRFDRPVIPQSYAAALHGIFEDAAGLLWIPTSRGLLRFDPATDLASLHTVGSGGASLSNLVTTVAQDRAGTLWLGTRAGLYKWDRHRKPFSPLSHGPGDPGSLGGSQVSALLEDASGRIWVGTYDGGLSRLDGPQGPLTRYRHTPGDASSLCHDSVWHLTEGASGTLWVGVNDGLCSYDPARDRFSRHAVELPVAKGHQGRIVYVVEGRSGRLWLGSHLGLVRFDPETGESIHYPVAGDQGGPSRGVFHSLYLEEGRILWLGTEGEGLVRLDVETGTSTNYPLVTRSGSVLRSEGIFQIHRSRERLLWLATGDGLSRFDPQTETFEHYFISDGLPGSVVYSILEDDEERLWLGTSNGLCRFDPGAPPGRRFRNFDLSDGIGNLEFNRHAAWRASDGRFLFGGMDGLTVFRPEEIRDNSFIPPVVLTGVRILSREGASELSPWGLERLTLANRQSSVSFAFAALSYTSPEKNRYAYKLEGFDHDWVDSGTLGSARYTHIPPGRYTFRVKGSNNDGVWNEEGLALPLTITPPYWQTWWFRLAVLALIVGALTALYRYRVARLLEIERLRVRIAGDLHDDLSSDLSGIALAAAMVERQDYLREQDRGRLAEVGHTAQSMLDGLRDIVWYINPEHDTLAAMVRRMKAVSSRLLAGHDVQFESSVAARDSEIDMTLRRNVFLIFKETLHNIARHSGAASVSIRFEQRKKALILEVTDDGVGFDPARVDGGFGLESMRRRADQMGATLTLDSRPGRGSDTRLEVNMARTRGGKEA